MQNAVRTHKKMVFCKSSFLITQWSINRKKSAMKDMFMILNAQFHKLVKSLESMCFEIFSSLHRLFWGHSNWKIKFKIFRPISCFSHVLMISWEILIRMSEFLTFSWDFWPRVRLVVIRFYILLFWHFFETFLVFPIMLHFPRFSNYAQ